jgi:uncharacterized integral membrane protein
VANPPVGSEVRASALSRVASGVALALKIGLFALVFMFALRNNEPVTLRLLPGYDWSTSLALALVGTLCLGAVLGVLAMSGHALRLRARAARAEAELAAARMATAPAAGQEAGRGV